MEQIIINHADGSKIKLHQSKQYINITSAEQATTLLNEDTVSIDLETSDKLDLYIGDSIVIYGAVYKMNQLPKVTKDGESKYTYSIAFEGVQYDLMRAIYDLTIDTTNNQLQEVQADSLVGDLNRFATVLISNANRVMPGQWVLGEVPDTDSDVDLTFSEDDNCLAVLQTLCKEFDTEFVITQSDGVNTINFKKTGQIFPYTFRFGRGRGLYQIERTNVDTANIVTRLKVYGAEKNLGNKYRALRLCLPDRSKGDSYIEEESPVIGYGIFENRKYFDDIYPTRTGSVESVDGVLKFTDSTMFDLNDKDDDGNTLYLIDGASAKIHFNSGNLAGYEFEISKYDHSTHEFTVIQDSNERGDSFPSNISEAYQFAIGDEYKIIDINMPDSYITDAENRLLIAAQDYYNENSQPKVSYSIAVTEEFIKRKYASSGSITNVFNIGDYLPIKDERIGIDKSVRLQSITRNLLKDYEYTLEVSDNVNTTILNRILDDVKDHEGVIKMNDLDNPSRSRANWRTSRDTLNMVFDPDGDYYSEKIKPESIDTMALSVGAKSMQFGLKDTVIQANYNGNKNVVFVKGGTLTHYSIEHGPWTLTDETITLTNDYAYYIYAKCSKSDNSGNISISQDQINVEGMSGYYHFLIGILNSVDNDLNARAISLMYGFTTINGSYITTGKIKSHSGDSYIDLDKNEFKLGDTSSSLSFANEKLTLKGTLVQSNSGDTSVIGVYRGSYSDSISYYDGDEVTYAINGKSSTYRYINQNPSTGHTPTNTAYWAIKAASGSDGAPGKTGPSLIYRGDWDSSKTYYGTSDRRDCVKYNGLYYAALSCIESHFASSTTPDLDTEVWGDFGANFESVATNLLLAENATIAGFTYADGVMNSQEETDGKKNLLLNGVTGLLQALIGNIGDFKIENGDLKGYKDGKEVIQYTTDNLSSVEDSQSYNAINYTTDLSSSGTKSATSRLDGDGQYYFYDTESLVSYIEFSITSGCKIDLSGFFTAVKSRGNTSVYISTSIKIYKSDVLLLTKTSNTFTALLNDPGTYKIVITNTVTAQASQNESFYWNGTLKYTLFHALYSVSPEKTVIASDGFMSIFGLTNYFRFQNNEGLTVMVGNAGLKIGNGAIKKTLDGNNWSNV